MNLKQPLNNPVLAKTVKLWFKKIIWLYLLIDISEFILKGFWNFPVCEVWESLTYKREPLWDSQ